jgi:hypothetical protein
LSLLPDDVLYTFDENERNRVAERMLAARASARRALEASREHMARQHQRQHARPAVTYTVGQLVYCYRPKVPVGGSVKLARFYNGPYRIDRVLPGERAYMCVHVHTGESRVCHVDNLKPYHTSELRDEVVSEPEPYQPTEAEVDRVIRYMDRSVRAALRTVPLSRLRPALSSALGDEYQRMPELARGTVLPLLPLPSLPRAAAPSLPQPVPRSLPQSLPPPVPTGAAASSRAPPSVQRPQLSLPPPVRAQPPQSDAMDVSSSSSDESDTAPPPPPPPRGRRSRRGRRHGGQRRQQGEQPRTPNSGARYWANVREQYPIEATGPRQRQPPSRFYE